MDTFYTSAERREKKPGFADALDTADVAIRRERRPLPSHDLHADNYRLWAAAVLHAEVKHCRDDFIRVASDLGVLGAFDLEAPGQPRCWMHFRLRHEIKAFTALEWLGALNMQDGDARGPWSYWRHWDRQRKREWARRRFYLKAGFWKAMAAYHVARAEIGAPCGAPAMQRAA